MGSTIGYRLDEEHDAREAYEEAQSHTAATDLIDGPIAGLKFDQDKIRMDLLPPHAMLEVAKVLTFGARKYAPDNWKKVEGREWRYVAAALRHINAHQRGEAYDPETGYHHLAHAICCLSFLLEEHELNLPEREGDKV